MRDKILDFLNKIELTFQCFILGPTRTYELHSKTFFHQYEFYMAHQMECHVHDKSSMLFAVFLNEFIRCHEHLSPPKFNQNDVRKFSSTTTCCSIRRYNSCTSFCYLCAHNNLISISFDGRIFA